MFLSRIVLSQATKLSIVVKSMGLGTQEAEETETLQWDLFFTFIMERNRFTYCE